MRRVTRMVPPEPGNTPSLISGNATRAPSSATMRSQHTASSRPPPKARPETAAIVGFGKSSTRLQASFSSASFFGTTAPAAIISGNSLMSEPAQNAFVAGAGQHHDAHRGVVGEPLDGVVEAPRHLERDEVERRVVEGDDGDAVLDRAQHRVLRHRIPRGFGFRPGMMPKSAGVGRAPSLRRGACALLDIQ